MTHRSFPREETSEAKILGLKSVQVKAPYRANRNLALRLPDEPKALTFAGEALSRACRGDSQGACKVPAGVRAIDPGSETVLGQGLPRTAESAVGEAVSEMEQGAKRSSVWGSNGRLQAPQRAIELTGDLQNAESVAAEAKAGVDAKQFQEALKAKS